MTHRWPETAAGRLLHGLERRYGALAPRRFTGPFEMVLWEIVAYLADDGRRDRAFSALRERVGLNPKDILAAPLELLQEITRIGGPIAANERAERLRTAARLVIDQFGGDLGGVLRLPPQKAKKLLMQFPMIGEPGAEKILLFCGAAPLLALESNGLRVLVRAGIGPAQKSYAATYRSIREATLEQLPADTPLLVMAHTLLRTHGQQICRNNDPACGACPVNSECLYFRNFVRTPGSRST